MKNQSLFALLPLVWLFGCSSSSKTGVGGVHLYVASVDGMSVVRVDVPGTNADASVRSFQWSPDGSRIAYQNRLSSTFNFDVYVAAADGSTNTRVNAPLPGTGNVAGFSWSPDGSQIAYRANIDVSTVLDLYVADGDGTNSRKINSAIAPGGGAEEFVWSPDSTRVAYVADEDDDGFEEVFVAVADGSGSTHVSSDVPPDANATLGTLLPQVWSPDSSQVAFTRDQLFIAEADGSMVTQVTQPLPAPDMSFAQTRPAWSSDGSRIAYLTIATVSGVPFGIEELHIVAPDASNDRLVSGPTVRNGQVLEIVGWSP